MKRITILFFAVFLMSFISAKSQSTQKIDPSLNIEKAKYLNGDLTRYLSKNVRYPKQCFVDRIQGDVIISFVVDRTGKVDSLAVISSPNNIISTSSILAFDKLDSLWSPAIINKKPIDKKYLIVFRYRMGADKMPSKYIISKKKANKLFEKRKYEKALKFYTKAIEENPYDFELFESRSKVKEILGNKEVGKLDYLTSINLKNEIMSVVDIVGIGILRDKRTVTYTTTRRH